MKKTEIILLTAAFLLFACLSYPTLRGFYLLKFKYRQTHGKILGSEIREVEQNEGDEIPRYATAYLPAFRYEY